MSRPAPTKPTAVTVVTLEDWTSAVPSAPVTAPEAGLRVNRASPRVRDAPASPRRPSVSTTTRQLIQAGVLERVRFPGDRNAYFQIRDDCWHELLHLEVARMRRLRELGEAGIKHLADAPPDLRRRMEQFRDFNAFFEREFPRLVELWDTQNKEHR